MNSAIGWLKARVHIWNRYAFLRDGTWWEECLWCKKQRANRRPIPEWYREWKDEAGDD